MKSYAAAQLCGVREIFFNVGGAQAIAAWPSAAASPYRGIKFLAPATPFVTEAKRRRSASARRRGYRYACRAVR